VVVIVVIIGCGIDGRIGGGIIGCGIIGCGIDGRIGGGSGSSIDGHRRCLPPMSPRLKVASDEVVVSVFVARTIKLWDAALLLSARLSGSSSGLTDHFGAQKPLQLEKLSTQRRLVE
jgi:hypothetical protein